VRLVKRGQRHERLEFRYHRVVDPHRRRELQPAVDHAVADRDDAVARVLSGAAVEHGLDGTLARVRRLRVARLDRPADRRRGRRRGEHGILEAGRARVEYEDRVGQC